MLKKCKCSNNKFFISAEKLYKGLINTKGVLCCEPEEEHITEIKCTKCSAIYKPDDFKEVQY